MNYRDYIGSRDLSWKILSEQQICALPVSVSAVCRNLGIMIKYYEPTDENSGYCTIICRQPVIFVSSLETPERQRFTAAHELGHILLGHVGKYRLVNRAPSTSDNAIEQAANMFAARLLAPACVLWGCGVTNAQQISKLCKISVQAAEFRMQRMQVLYKRQAFFSSSLERSVYANFTDFIGKNRFD